MAVQAQYLAYVTEQLAGLRALRTTRMFGGIGLYSDGLFFGLIDDDTLYFKTGEPNIADYLARRMPRFMPFPDKTGAVMGYHQVPADVIEDPEMLLEWARKAVSVASAAQAAKAAKPRKAPANEKPKKVTKKKAARAAGNTVGKRATRKSSTRKPGVRKSPARKK